MEAIKFLEDYVPILVHGVWIIYALLAFWVFAQNTVLSLIQMGCVGIFDKLNKVFFVPVILIWMACEMFWIKGGINVPYLAGGIGLGIFFMWLLKYLATINYLHLEKKFVDILVHKVEADRIEYLVFFEDKVIWEEASMDEKLINFLKAEVNDSYVARVEEINFEKASPFKLHILTAEEYDEEFEDEEEKV